MSHEPHSGVSGPTFLVLVADDIFEIGVRLFRKKSLDEISGFICAKSEEDPNLVNVPRIQSDWMSCLCFLITKLKEIIRTLRGSCKFAGTLKT